MAICVEIEIDDNGQVSVGVCPQDEETSADETAEKSYMMPAASVQDALKTAVALLASKQSGAMSSAKPAMGMKK